MLVVLQNIFCITFALQKNRKNGIKKGYCITSVLQITPYIEPKIMRFVQNNNKIEI